MNGICAILEEALSGKLGHDLRRPGWLEQFLVRCQRSRHLRHRKQRLIASLDVVREYGRALLAGQDADLLTWMQNQAAALCGRPWFWVGGELGSGSSFLLRGGGARLFQGKR